MDRSDEHDCGGDVAAYALGALDADEVAGFERHLDICAICRDELAAFGSVVAVLPMSATAVRPPRQLKRRVMGAVTAEARRDAARSSRRGVRPRWLIAFPRVGIALAAVIAAVLVAGALTLSGSSVTGTRVITAQVIGESGHAHVRVSGNRAELVVDHLPAPPAGHIYEVWLRRPGRAPTPTTALFSVTRSGSANVDVPGSLAGVSTMMVTPEPAGGSRSPTGNAVIKASLT